MTGAPILSAECCCTSCRAAGDRFEQLPGAPDFRTALKTSPYVLMRKDRVRFVALATLHRGLVIDQPEVSELAEEAPSPFGQ